MITSGRRPKPWGQGFGLIHGLAAILSGVYEAFFCQDQLCHHRPGGERAPVSFAFLGRFWKFCLEYSNITSCTALTSLLHSPTQEPCVCVWHAFGTDVDSNLAPVATLSLPSVELRLLPAFQAACSVSSQSCFNELICWQKLSSVLSSCQLCPVGLAVSAVFNPVRVSCS